MSSQLSPVTNSSPERVAIYALSERILPPPLNSSRVLELASGEGENIIPLAFWLQEAGFYGFDSDPEKNDRARRQAETLELENLQFTSSKQELEPRSFDYIIASNVFSFVSSEVKHRILDLGKRLLKPEGLLFIRYHPKTATLKRRRLRELLMPLADRSTPETSLALFEMMGAFTNLNPQNERQSESQLECKIIQSSGPAAALDYLRAQALFPLNPSEMRAIAGEHQLDFVGEMNHGGLESRRYLDGIRKWISQRTHGAVDAEDLIDFFGSPEYREEVFCHRDHFNEPKATAEQRIDRLWFETNLSTARPDVNLSPEIEVGFRTNTGKIIKSKSPLEKALLKHMSLSQGRATPVKELLEKTLHDTEEALDEPLELRDEKLELLVEAVTDLSDQGILKLRLREPNQVPQDGPIPTIIRWQAERGYLLSTEHHDLVAADELTRAIILELARGRPPQELLPYVEGLIERGDLVFSEDMTKKSASERQKFTKKTVETAIEQLRQHGLIRQPETVSE